MHFADGVVEQNSPVGLLLLHGALALMEVRGVSSLGRDGLGALELGLDQDGVQQASHPCGIGPRHVVGELVRSSSASPFGRGQLASK